LYLRPEYLIHLCDLLGGGRPLIGFRTKVSPFRVSRRTAVDAVSSLGGAGGRTAPGDTHPSDATV